VNAVLDFSRLAPRFVVGLLVFLGELWVLDVVGELEFFFVVVLFSRAAGSSSGLLSWGGLVSYSFSLVS
jgi:hypothetical protein